jgi:hypothetical protein
MNTARNRTKSIAAALAAAAATVVAPAVLFAGAGTAHADCDGALLFSYYCSPGGGGLEPREELPRWPSTWDFQPPREQFLPPLELHESPPYPLDGCGYLLENRNCDN